MTKGRNTFEGYQKAKQDGRERLMVSYLEQLTNSRVRFQHVTGLADMVAKYIAHQQQKPCSKSTLLRNNRYKTLLLTFMAAHLGTGTKSLKLRDTGDERANALVTSAQLEAANLKRESVRLKAYITHLEQNQHAVQIPVAPEAEQLRSELHDMALKYTRTCQALYAILKHFGETLSVEADRQLILDMSKLRNNVVVESTIAAPFFEWLRLNGDVPSGLNA
jgi:phage host-nuclease inhibitor protein Gam